MKKTLLLVVLSTLTLGLFAWNSPVTIPDVGNARLRIVGQNAANYVSNLESSNSSCDTQEEFEAKTNKIANAFIALQADIVAICEVERNDEILGYIVDAMNTIYGENVYTYITDGLYAHASSGNYQSLKSGYIYRSDKVTPQGNNTSPYRSGEYCARLRIQAFEENSTHEKFVLSMNHFKAKDNYSDDAGESIRLQNVSNLIDALGDITSDPDILIMGDLNSYMGEAPIEALEEEGFEEQLVRFDANAYSYIYRGQKGILDHAMANSTMAEQVTGARVYHINTAGGYNYKYSDHDAVLVGLSLGKQQRGENLNDVSTTSRAHKVLHNGQLYIEIDGIRFTITGTKIQ